MSATTHETLKAEIETAYEPVEDNSFAENSDNVAYSGYGSCYNTDPDYMPSC